MSTYVTATKARKNFFALMERASHPGFEVNITRNGIPAVVMMSFEEYEGLMETLEIMSDPQLVKDINEAMKEKGGIPLEELEKELQIKPYVPRHSATKGRKTVSKTTVRRPTKNHRRAAKTAK